MKILKTTPILCVDQIERCLPFWTQNLGYTKTVEVPHNDRIGFVILQKDGSEIMLQIIDSIKDDVANIGKIIKTGDIMLYSDVDSIAELEKNLKGLEIVVPLRKTFYGAMEIFIRDSNGQIHGFAEHAK